MSNETTTQTKQEETKNKIPELIRWPQKYKLIVKEGLEQKIRYMCNKFWTREWSGILFYQVTGTFENNDLTIHCVDFFPMDIGSGAATDFDMSPEVMGYVCDNNLMDYHMGLIHSHNTMATFFSGTDTNTLRAEGNDQNHFVSLIVNNAGSYTAAVTRKAKVERKVIDTISYESWDGVKVDGSADETEFTTEEIQYFYLDVDKEGSKIDLSALETRLKAIEQEKAQKRVVTTTTNVYRGNGNVATPPALGQANTRPFQPTLFEEFNREGGEDKLPFESPVSNDQKKAEKEEKKKKGQELLEEEDDQAPEGFEIDENLAKTLCVQLLTGSVMITDPDFKLAEFASEMGKIIERRFGEGEEGMSRWEDFLDWLIEWLLSNADEEYSSEPWYIMMLSDTMWEILAQLPKNKYVEVCQNKLLSYMY